MIKMSLAVALVAMFAVPEIGAMFAIVTDVTTTLNTVLAGM